MANPGNSMQAILDQAAREAPAPSEPRRARRTQPVESPAPIEPAAAEPATKAPARAAKPVAGRKDKRFIGGYFTESVFKELHMLGVEDDLTVQDMIGEALELLFIKHGKSKAAALLKK